MTTIKGLPALLTPADIGQIIQRQTHYVIRSLLRCGVIQSIREGARGWRVKPVELEKYLEKRRAQ